MWTRKIDVIFYGIRNMLSVSIIILIIDDGNSQISGATIIR